MPSSIEASAPGKLFLLGEHAVLYGIPAIICAVDKRITVKLTPADNNKIRVKSGLGVWETDISDFLPSARMKLISAITETYLPEVKKGFGIEINSDFPHDLGLGSSAALTIASVGAFQTFTGNPLPDKQLFEKAYDIHRSFQGGGSGGDLAASLKGGIILYAISPPEYQQIPVNPPLFAVYSGRKTPTIKMIGKVAEFKDKFPGKFRKIMNEIFQIIEKAYPALESGNWEKLGHLMSMNHKCLAALGVSSPEIDELVNQIESIPGVFGAKISGAGMGDCIIGTGKPEYIPENLNFFPVRIPPQGLKIEKN